MKKYILVLLFLVLTLLIPFIHAGTDIPTQRLNFDAIKTKYIDVDINITIPVILNNYNEDNSFTFVTPIFSSQRSQIVTKEVYYIDNQGNKVPAVIEKDELGNENASFTVDPIKQNRYDFIISAKIVSENKTILPKIKYDLNKPITDFNEFLEPTKNIQSNRSEIISLANSIKTSNDAITEITTITNWVHQNITYDLSYADVIVDAVNVQEKRAGVCDEYANLTAALLRARGIPTRYVSGYANSTLSWEAHAWLEAYVPGYDWISVDPTYGEIGMVDSSHLIISKAKDPDDIKDRITTMSTVNLEFLEKEKSFDIKSQKSYADYGYSNVLNVVLDSPEKMRSNSAFTIKAKITNTTANPISTLTILRTNESFTQIYPKYSEEIIYLDPFETKEFIYHFILPELDQSMYYNYILATQYKDVENNVSVYLFEGLYQEAFLVLDPVFYFKDNKLAVDFNVINHTNKSKTLKIDFNYCGNLSTESKIIQKQTTTSYEKSFDKIDSCKLNIVISGDYDYSKSIMVYPTQEIEVIEPTPNPDNNSSTSIDVNEPGNIWTDFNNMKIKEQNNDGRLIGYILIGLFVLAMILFLVYKPKKQVGNLTHI